MVNNVYQELNQIFSVLASNSDIKHHQNGVTKIGNPELIKLDEDLHSPITGLKNKLQTKTSPLPNQPVDINLLESLVKEITKYIRGFNHLGFCYHVNSQSEERGLLTKDNTVTQLGLYEEPSNDSAKWYFIGNPTILDVPMIELLPVESQNDTFIDYWMPHIHIDIDTNLDENQLESILYKVYDGDPKPFRSTVIDNVVYSTRTRLGIIDGINLFLDLSTKHMNVEHSRKNILKKLS